MRDAMGRTGLLLMLLTAACGDGAGQERVAQTVGGNTAAPTGPSVGQAQPSAAGAPRPGMTMMLGAAGAPMSAVGSAGRTAVPAATPTGGVSAMQTPAAISGSGAVGGSPAAGGSIAIAMAGAGGAVGIPSAGAAPMDGDLTSVCKGGKVGMDSDSAKAMGLNVSREFGAVKYLSAASNPILSLKTTLLVPKVPASKQTLFIWPGLQCRGASDPGRIGNGILQPVLTWGSSCAPKAPKDVYANWWMAAMYVNVSSNAAGPSGCAGGDYMDTQVGDQLFIDMSQKDNKWTQTVVNMRTMKSVDLTSDLKGQVQNWATWAVEVPSGESIKPAEDTVFTQNVLTFTNPVTTCQPNQAGGSDYYSAPVLSPDGLHCCYDKIILRVDRTK